MNAITQSTATPPAPSKPKLTGKPAEIVRAFNKDFCAHLPGDARFGRYSAETGDSFAAERYRVPDGRFRVTGSEWVLCFQNQRFVDAIRAVPPDFGGADVVEVP
jgi:hypothetical protein